MFMKFGELLPMLEEDSGLEVGAGGEEQEVAEPAEAEETGEEVSEVAEPAEAEEEEDGRTDADSAFAQLRREKEEAERKLAQAEDALGLFFDGDDKTLKAHAYAEDKPLEEVKAEFEAKQEKERLEAENKILKERFTEMEVETRMQQDLLDIQKVDPSVKDLDELGDEFFKMMSTGMVDGVTAYHAVKAMEKSNAISTPEIPGKANQSPEDKSYYSREEVMAMSPQQVHDNYDKIRASQTKW